MNPMMQGRSYIGVRGDKYAVLKIGKKLFIKRFEPLTSPLFGIYDN